MSAFRRSSDNSDRGSWFRWTRFLTALSVVLGIVVLGAGAFYLFSPVRIGLNGWSVEVRIGGVAPDDGGRKPPESEAGAGESTAELQFTGTKLVGRYQGQKQWELETRSVEIESSKKITRLTGITNGVLFRDGVPYLTLKGGDGVWYQDTNDLTLTGDILVTWEDRGWFRAPVLEWRGADEILTAPGGVNAGLDDSTLRADHLIADFKQEKIEVSGNVVLEEPGKHVIKASKVVYDTGTEVLEVIGAGEIEFGMPGSR